MWRGVRNARIVLVAIVVLGVGAAAVALLEGKPHVALGLVPVFGVLWAYIQQADPKAEHRALTRREIVIPLLVVGGPVLLLIVLAAIVE